MKRSVTMETTEASTPTLRSDEVPIFDDYSNLHDPACAKQPSSCECRSVLWIFARIRPNYKKPNGDTDPGKWMIFPPRDLVDSVWLSVKQLLLQGKLCCSATVSPASQLNAKYRMHLICVYTNNYSDKEDVFRVLLNLRDFGHAFYRDRQLNYKTDAATYAGLYSHSAAGRSVCLYTSPAPRGGVVQMWQHDLKTKILVAERIASDNADGSSEGAVESAIHFDSECISHHHHQQQQRSKKRKACDGKISGDLRSLEQIATEFDDDAAPAAAT